MIRFQISEVQADGHWVPLTDYRASINSENVFTLIIGQNAVGKSRLLRKIVSNYIFSSENRTKTSERHWRFANQNSPYDFDLWNRSLNSAKHENHKNFISDRPSSYSRLYEEFDYNTREVITSSHSNSFPSNVIAVSTGRHDRFPSETHVKNKNTIADYRYIGTDQFSRSSVSSSLISLLEGLLQGRQNLQKLSNIFEYLGFAPYIDIRLSVDKNRYSRFSHEEISELHRNSNSSLLDIFVGDDNNIQKDYSSARHLKPGLKSNIELDFWDYSLEKNHQKIDELIPFLKSGLIKIFDITLIQLVDKSRLHLSQASSGQQCMLTIMLGIAGAIKDGSLICIDEPEISLHPQWQSNLVRQLQEVFSDFSGCHFVIATHSPQLVSGLTSKNGYVLNLEEKKLYHSFEYAKRSADFQLAEVFHTPGQNNEYLLRITLILLTKLSRREKLSDSDRENIKKLVSVRKNMNATDPVYHLIGQVEALH